MAVNIIVTDTINVYTATLDQDGDAYLYLPYTATLLARWAKPEGGLAERGWDYLSDPPLVEGVLGWYVLLGDVNGDNRVNVIDFNAVRGDYGRCAPSDADLDRSGCVSVTDFNILRGSMGLAGLPQW